jgi:hypothetical protein
MTLGRAATARALLIVWRKACSHQVEPDPAEMAARYGAKTPVGAIGGCARGAAAHRRHGSRATELPSRAPEMFRPCPPARQGDVLKFGHDLAAKHCRLLPHRNVLSYCCSHSLPSLIVAGIACPRTCQPAYPPSIRLWSAIKVPVCYGITKLASRRDTWDRHGISGFKGWQEAFEESDMTAPFGHIQNRGDLARQSRGSPLSIASSLVHLQRNTTRFSGGRADESTEQSGGCLIHRPLRLSPVTLPASALRFRPPRCHPHRPPCPRCGGRMIIVEVFARGAAPRGPPYPGAGITM